MWLPINIGYFGTKHVTGVTCFYTVFITWRWCMLYLSTCITMTNKIGDVFFYSGPVDFALALHLEILKWPLWRHLRYSSCKDHGIMIPVPFITTPSVMLKFPRCIQNAWRSGSISACWSHCLMLIQSAHSDLDSLQLVHHHFFTHCIELILSNFQWWSLQPWTDFTQRFCHQLPKGWWSVWTINSWPNIYNG